MKLSELIEYVGNDDVQFQALQGSLVKAETKKNDGEITFATDKSKVIQMATTDKPDYVCLVVWLPREKMPENLR